MKADRMVGWLRRRGVRRPFILTVGGVERQSNLANILRAFARLREEGGTDRQLVVIGVREKEHPGIDMLFNDVEARPDQFGNIFAGRDQSGWALRVRRTADQRYRGTNHLS